MATAAARRAAAMFRAAVLAHRRQDYAAAIDGYRDVLRADPDHADACNNLGVALRASGRIEAAVAAYRRALALNPRNAGAHSNLGNSLRALGRFAEAEAAHRAALALDPNYVEATYNLGLVYRDQGRYAEALRPIEAAIAARPGYVDAQWDRALALLALGDFAAGFPAYEWRWRLAETRPRALAAPRWDGGPLGTRTILLHAEQGLGDSLQFVRYAPLVAARGGRVVLEVQAPLARLMATLPGGAAVVVQGEPPPAHDVQAPLLSLPAILGTTLATVPAAIPYLGAAGAPPPALAAALHAPGGRLRVGLVWAGKPTHNNDRNRSLPLGRLLRLLEVPGIAWYSLQKGPAQPQLKATGADALMLDLDPLLGDFADTAHALARLDLVIAVDTSVAHLAGAMGRPCWVLLPFAADWRWLTVRDDSPWYPSLRLFRQTAFADWDGVIDRVAAALGDLAARHR